MANSAPSLPTPLSLGQRLSYGLGGTLEYTNMNMLQMLATPIFVAQLGVNPAFIGLIFFAQRIWDGITDPIMAHISDNHRGRWGRRRVFMLYGGLATAVLYSAVWFFPAGWEITQYQVWFAITAFLFMTASTVYAVPYQALGCEMTRDFHERTRVMGYRVSFGHLAFLYAIWIFYLVELGKDRGVFADTPAGLKIVVGVYGVLIAGAAVVSSLKTRERFYAEVATSSAKINFTAALRYTLGNRPFLLLLLCGLLTTFAQIVVANLQSLLNIYYVSGGSLFRGALFAALFGTAIMLSSMATIPLFNRMSQKWGKRSVLIACIFLQFLGAALKWFLFNPDTPYLQIIVALLQGPGIAGSTVLMGSMITDVCDLDELEHGSRREAMFVAINNWVVKLAGALAVLVGGYLALWVGYQAGEPTQDPGVLITMKAMFAFLPAAGSLAAIAAIWAYPIDARRVAEMRAELDRRHASATNRG